MQCQRPSIEQELTENNAESSIFLSHILSDNSDSETKILSATNEIQIEWILAAMAIDRISFIILSHIFAFMTIICLL